MNLVLKSVENTSYKGQRSFILCDESGNRLPCGQISIGQDDASGVVTATAHFKVDGKTVTLS